MKYVIGAVVGFGVLIGVLILRQGDKVEQMRRGLAAGLTKACIERGSKPKTCERVGKCVADEFVKRLGEERIRELSGPGDMTARDRAALLPAAVHCRKVLGSISR